MHPLGSLMCSESTDASRAGAVLYVLRIGVIERLGEPGQVPCSSGH